MHSHCQTGRLHGERVVYVHMCWTLHDMGGAVVSGGWDGWKDGVMLN